MMKHKCIKCGFCCRQQACVYGEWDQNKQRCASLDADNLCGKYEEVKNDPASPAMGCGCCSSLNEDRLNKLIELGELPADTTFEEYFLSILGAK